MLRLADVVRPQRELLEVVFPGTSLTKRVAKNRVCNDDDVSSYVWLEPAATCAAAATAGVLRRRYAAMEVPQVWVSDTATHFKNRALRLMAKTLGVSHRFTIANSPWINGAVECIIREIVRTFKALLSEWHHPLGDWVQVLPVVSWPLNAAYRERYQACPYKILFGREPGTPFAMLSEQGNVEQVVFSLIYHINTGASVVGCALYQAGFRLFLVIFSQVFCGESWLF